MTLDASEFYKQDFETKRQLIRDYRKSKEEAEKQPATPAEGEAALIAAGGRKITGSQQDQLKWLFAGRAIFTVRNSKTGNRFTYSISKNKKDEKLFWVAVLRGPDNTSDYTPLGRIVNNDSGGTYLRNRSSRIGEDAQSHKVFAWFFQQLSAGTLPDFIEIWHAGRCGRCGRLLTVPESISRGIGPECASMF
jgi:hypothetical protein